MSELLYPRDKLGAWIKANAPAEYGPATRIRLVAREDGMCVVTECPEDITIPAPEDLPEVGNLTDVEKYKEVFVGARQNATLLVDTIKASVQDALVKSGAYSASEATIQGVDFVFYHGNDIANYKEAGGHPAAASKLLSAFKSEGSVALFPWVKSVGAIFDQALTY